MSCWRKQKVLRMPARTVGIETGEEWEAFEAVLREKGHLTDGGEGDLQ